MALQVVLHPLKRFSCPREGLPGPGRGLPSRAYELLHLPPDWHGSLPWQRCQFWAIGACRFSPDSLQVLPLFSTPPPVQRAVSLFSLHEAMLSPDAAPAGGTGLGHLSLERQPAPHTAAVLR